MPVTSTINKVIYTGTGGTATYAFSFNIYITTDLIVTTKLISTGAYTVLSLGTDYTVSTTTPLTAGPSAGTITLTAGVLPATKQLIIQRILPLTQLIDLADNSGTPAATWEEGYDRAVMLIQQLQEQLNRVLIQGVTSNTQLTFPDLIANRFLTNNGSSLAWANIITTATTYPGGISVGLESNLPATPNLLDLYLALDTQRWWVCAQGTTWYSMPGIISGSKFTGLSSIPSGAGLIPISNLGTGTPDGTKFLRDDGVFATPTTTAGGKLLQHVYKIDQTQRTYSIPNYFPYTSVVTVLNTKGAEFTQLAASITPSDANNIIKVRATVQLAADTYGNGVGVAIALFNYTGAINPSSPVSALEVSFFSCVGGAFYSNGGAQLQLEWNQVASTTSQIDYRIHLSPYGGYGVYVNGYPTSHSAPLFSCIEIQEIAI